MKHLSWFAYLLMVTAAGCDASPFITDDMESSRRDLDGDGVPNVDDCAPEDPDVTFLTVFNDLDGDGFGAGDPVRACELTKGLSEHNTDCDDTSKFVHPKAAEICNDIDDNCDKVVDDDAVDRPIWHKDDDKDTFGDPTQTLTQCKKPAGYVSDNTDCDDGSKNVRPGATEVCNDIDDNCDKVVDDDAVDRTTWVPDGDGDGFGDMNVPVGPGSSIIVSCDKPDGYVKDKTDCDDGNKFVHPGAEEVCNDVDDDCDKSTDEDAVDAPTWFADKDQDTYGDATNSQTVCKKPGGYVADKSDCDDVSKFVRPDADEICNGIDDNCDGTTDTDATDQPTWFEDADKDGYGNVAKNVTQCLKPTGYVLDSTDCEDLAKDVHPNAAEVCNGVDDDCDGATDEVFTTKWYQDSDNDLFGNPDVSKIACSKPMGYVDNASDCDDSKPSINPNAVEVCDNKIDENCNKIVDDAPGASKWYVDMDGDTAGNPLSFIFACVPPPKYVTNTDDCDDFNPSVNPWVAEACGDKIDNNCNGITDTDAVDAPWYEDKDKDGYGNQDVVKTACAPPPGFVGNDLDCDDTKNGVNPTVAEVCNNGIDDNCDGGVNQCAWMGEYSAQISDHKVQGDEKNLYISTVEWIGDFNGDGNEDFVICLPSAFQMTGVIYLFLGPIQVGNLSLKNANAKWIGESPEDAAGTAIAGLGDINGDGKMDFVVGAPGHDTPKNNAGAVYLILGHTNPSGGSLSMASAKWTGMSEGEAAGSAVFVADFIGDNHADILIGAPLNDHSAKNDGTVYLISGTDSPLGGSLAAIQSKWFGEAAEDFSGKSLSGGDINGDGKYEVLIAGHGGLYIINSSSNPNFGSLSQATAKWVGETKTDFVGSIALSAGDVNGDLKDDIVIGLAHLSSGWIYLILGSAAITGGDLTQAKAKWTGESLNDKAGLSVAMSDLTGDGLDEIVIGAPENDKVADNAGTAYLIKGTGTPMGGNLGAVASAKWRGSAEIDQFGTKVAARKDLLVAAPYQDVTLPNQGVVHLFKGLGL